MGVITKHRVDDAPYGIQVLDWYEREGVRPGPLRLKDDAAAANFPGRYLQVRDAAGYMAADCLVGGDALEPAKEWLLNFVSLVVPTVEGGE